MAAINFSLVWMQLLIEGGPYSGVAFINFRLILDSVIHNNRRLVYEDCTLSNGDTFIKEAPTIWGAVSIQINMVIITQVFQSLGGEGKQNYECYIQLNSRGKNSYYCSFDVLGHVCLSSKDSEDGEISKRRRHCIGNDSSR